MTIARQDGDQVIQSTDVNFVDWKALLPHCERLSRTSLRAMVDSAADMLADPENPLINRVSLIGVLRRLRDRFDLDLQDILVATLEPIARGEIEDPNRHQNHPLSHVKFNTTTPEQLRATALIGLAQIASREPDRYRDRVQSQIEDAMTCASAEVRRGAVSAFHVFPCRSDILLLCALLATRDPDPIAAASAFAAIGGKSGLSLNRNHWRILLLAARMALLSHHVDLRCDAASTLSRLRRHATSGPLRREIGSLLELFLQDESASVRAAARDGEDEQEIAED